VSRSQIDEFVFSVSGASATPLTQVPIAGLSFTERQHLQEWIIANPRVLGPDVRVITFEFAQWTATSSPPKDRLDVLGLCKDGHLVVAELKRGLAPDTTDVQAIKYAAMVSRFTLEVLAAKHRVFRLSRGEHAADVDTVLADIVAHTDGQISDETLRRPRIVLVAEDFSTTTTSSAVWLTEVGVDISLITYRAYQTPSGETVVTTSRLWPVPQAEQFVASPRPEAIATVDILPQVPWSDEELTALAGKAGEFMLAVLDSVSTDPAKRWGTADFAHLGFTPYQISGAVGAITTASRHQFGRSNTPLTLTQIGGVWRWSMDSEMAVRWRHVRGLELDGQTEGSS